MSEPRPDSPVACPDRDVCSRMGGICQCAEEALATGSPAAEDCGP